MDKRTKTIEVYFSDEYVKSHQSHRAGKTFKRIQNVSRVDLTETGILIVQFPCGLNEIFNSSTWVYVNELNYTEESED